MTALSATSIVTWRPASMELHTGTTDYPVRCALVVVSSTAVDDTLDLSSIFPNDILSIQETLDGAQNGGTANTWSTYTITTAGHAGDGLWELIIWGY